MRRYVIIGNSAAGVGAVEGIRQIDGGGAITVVSNERYHTYSRPLISYLLQGKVSEASMRYRDENFYRDNNVALRHGTATGVDAGAKKVILSDGGAIPYDKLLVATGSSAFLPPLAGLETVENKTTFVGLDDAKKLKGMLNAHTRALIVGAGLIGLKCAEGIVQRAARVTVLDLAPQILPSILDDGGAKIMQRHLEDQGIDFRLAANIRRFEGDTAILECGDVIAFDLLVLAVGVRPNTALLQGIAEIGRGIAVNERSETTASDIYAAGDCTETQDISDGRRKVMALLPNAYMQGRCAGLNMAEGADPAGEAASAEQGKVFDRAMPMNAIGFFGLQVITAGHYNGEVYAQEQEGGYKRLFYSGGFLNGFILIGKVEKAGIYTALIRRRVRLDDIDFALVCEKPGLMAFAQEERQIRLGGGSP